MRTKIKVRKKNKFLQALFTCSLRFFCLLLFQFLLTITHAQCGSFVSTFPYNEGFESAPSWTAGGTNSSWAWGQPAHPLISSAGGGLRCWCSGGLTGSSYSGSQQSWIISPCFDFSTLNYPWISFKLFWECEYIWDGLTFQYSLNGGTTWTNVGSTTDPVNCLNSNWFNYSNISNLTQATPKHGWCGRVGATSGACAGGNGSATWVTAKHCLTALANQPSVRFRFLFGSGTTCNSYDGIAIDDILIQNAPANQANFSYTCLANNTFSFTNTSSLCPTSFAWNFGDPASGGANTSAAQNPTHLFSTPGTYSISLTTGGPCNAPSTTVIAVSVLSASINSSNLTCFGNSNGSSTVIPNGGSPSYSYTWSPTGGNSSVASGLNAGQYTVTVKDTRNCTASVAVLITQPASITVSISKTNVSCSGLSNGALSANPVQINTPYTYTWMPLSAFTQQVNNLSAGSYTLMVKDGNNCSVTLTTNITQPLPLNVTLTHTNISCYGGNNGVIAATGSGGTLPYTFSWNPVASNSSFITGLNSGTYSVTIIDANNCQVSASHFLGQPVLLNGSVITNTPTCGLANGSAVIMASGGSAPYTYTWSMNGSNSQTLTNLIGGNYFVTVKDASNCVTTITTSINNSSAVMLSLQSFGVSCFGMANGSATATVLGGIAPYSYTWFPGVPQGQGTASISSLTAGSYSLQVADVNNCIAATTFSVASPLPLQLGYTTTHVACHGTNSGSILLSATGGTQPYSFTSTTLGNVGTSINNLAIGDYVITLKDANNCTNTASISIFQPPLLTGSLTVKHVTCKGLFNGTASVSVNGGVAPYSYAWSSAAGSSSVASGLAAGTYTAYVTDQNNCNLTLSLQITQPQSSLTTGVQTKSASCFGKSDGGATVTASGGTGGYGFSWMGYNFNSPSKNNLLGGTYSVLVTDANNCTNLISITILEPPPLLLKGSASKFCKGATGVLTASLNGGIPPINYNWNQIITSTSTLAITPVSSTKYLAFASDSKGCVSNVDTIKVDVPLPLVLSNNKDFSICEGESAWLRASANGGDGSYSFKWWPGELTGPFQKISPKASQVFSVMVTDGCQTVKTNTLEVKFYPVPTLSIVTDVNTGCPPLCVNFSIVPQQALPAVQSFTWNFSNDSISYFSSPKYCYKTSGNYQGLLSFTTKDGCVVNNAANKSINVITLPKAQFTVNEKMIDVYNSSVDFINRSVDAVSYQWYFNNRFGGSDENPTFTFENAGDQIATLIVENEFGCKDTAMRTIKIKPEFAFFMPNCFTPDGDGINDVLFPKGMGWKPEKYLMTIYSRWGEKLYETKDPWVGWDGKTSDGMSVIKNDIYFWVVLVYDFQNKRYDFMGEVKVNK